MKSTIFNVGELRQVIKESASEFKPKMGDGVERDNKRNNEKSYKESEKRAKNFDGGLQPQSKKPAVDRSMDKNANILDYNPKTEPSKEYKERVKAQAKGYTSTLEEKNGIEKDGEYDDDGRIYKAMKDNANKRNKAKEDLANAGLVARELPKDKKNSMYEGKMPTPKRLKFKREKFMNEAQVLSFVPEQYKVDGQKIFMRDCQNNEFIVECRKIDANGRIETVVSGFKNEDKAAKQLERINELFAYKTKKEFGPMSNSAKVNEAKSFGDLMALSRKLNEVKEEDTEE